MKKIHFLGNREVCFTRHLQPIRAFKNELTDLGLEVKFFSDPMSSGITECDTLVFFEANYRDILPITNKDRKFALEFLSKFFDRFENIVWFDDHDSSGMLRTYIFPYVNTYAKAQILTDTSYYQEPHQMGVLHRDYVYENFHVDDRPTYKGWIPTSEIEKIKIGWNLGMCNWMYQKTGNPIIKRLLSYNKSYRLSFTVPDLKNRNLHISYRAGMRESIPTVNWWRKTTREYLDKFVDSHPQFMLNQATPLKKRAYNKEMRSAIVTPSPFGIGEICYRDFECFINGSLLLKPNMDHIRTWPDLYVDGETYVSHNWDFSDFCEKLDSILSHPEEYEEIARQGQKRFRDSLTNGHGFAQHFMTILTSKTG